MGQEEMRRCCQMSGRRRRAREHRLTKIFTSYKGDAIMKKRIIALVLACMLICSIAVTASAATVTYSGRYENCLYTASTYCEEKSCGGVIEGTPVNGTTEADYLLRVKLNVVRIEPNYGYNIFDTFEGNSSTWMASNNQSFDEVITGMTAYYYINDTRVYYKTMT